MGLCSQNELAFLYETLLSGSQNSIEVTNGDMFQIMQYGYVVGSQLAWEKKAMLLLCGYVVGYFF